MINITEQQYLEAKKITDAYENERKRLFNIRLEEFKNDLAEYFKTNRVDGCYIEEFELRGTMFGSFDIIPTKPCIEECYEGENNDDIKKLCEKHKISASFVYWMYPK